MSGKNAGQCLGLDNLPQKTPVSLLMELCEWKHVTATFELLANEGQDHDPIFVHRVSVLDMSANGTGKTKKIAKHNAAKNLLLLIIAQNRNKEWRLGNTAGEASLYLDLVLAEIPGANATTDNVSENAADGAANANFERDPVGKLKEICSRKQFPFPMYEVIEESGLSHEKTFVVQIRLGNFVETAKNRTKKAAKHDAAQKMIAFLQNVDNQSQLDELELAIEDNDENINVNENKPKPAASADSEDVSAFDDFNGKSLVQLENKKSLSDLLKMDLHNKLPTIEMRNLFDAIGREQNLNIEYILLPQLRKNGDYQCLVKFAESAVCAGWASTVDEAKSSAALASLHYLKIANAS